MKIDSLKRKSDIENCPQKSGMYWLYKKTDYEWIVVYLGISVNVQKRLKQHLLVKDFDAFFYEIIDYQIAKKREKDLLRGYKDMTGRLPPLNKQIG